MGVHMKFMRLLMFGTVMLMANGAGAQNSVKPFHLDEATISEVHAAGAIRFVNRQTELLFGHDREQLIGQHINVLVPEVLWPFYDRRRGDLVADPQSRSIGVD